MNKINAMAAVLVAVVAVLIGLVSLPKKPRPVLRTDRDGKHIALISRYEKSVARLDSLDRDSASIPRAEWQMNRRLLSEARTRRDHTQYALGLLGRADTTDPAAWEIARAAAQDSLDSLERYLNLAREGSWQRDASGPPPSRALIEAAKESE